MSSIFGAGTGSAFHHKPTPPPGCYFEVTLFPGYQNPVKLAWLLANKREASFAFWTLFNAPAASTRRDNENNFGKTNNYQGKDGGDHGFFKAFINPIDFQFHKVSGLSARVETEEIRVGGTNAEMIQLPNRVVHNHLVLERGIFVGSPLALEFDAAMTFFKFIPSEILVTLQSPDNDIMASWLFRNAYPVAWSNSDLWADDSSASMEKMEFAYSHYYPFRF